jgi:hypothetical protein
MPAQVSFLVTLMPGIDYGEDPMSNENFVKTFKMATTVSESNMVLVHGTVHKCVACVVASLGGVSDGQQRWMDADAAADH